VGGAIGGGLPLSRPDLHFYYNLLEELVLIIAYLYQIQRLPLSDEILPPLALHLSQEHSRAGRQSGSHASSQPAYLEQESLSVGQGVNRK